MKNIDDYILDASNMKNTSDGGSEAYHFDDGVVLVKYRIPTKYGIARENEELIAQEANKKCDMGVNTPRHLAIKRVYDEKENICWVLQQRAKGLNFYAYSSYRNEPKRQLQLQEELLNAPDVHYEKCVSDLCELFNMGLELKAKNIFYDNSIDNGGFTFIDLLSYESTPLNPDSIKDILKLNKYLQSIYRTTRIISYGSSEENDEDIKKSKYLYYKMIQKCFMAMEKVIPRFEQYRRWVLRSYSEEVLEFFKSNGTFVGDLTLNENEYDQFNKIVGKIVEDSLEKIESGKYEFWQIDVNEIRIDLDSMGMQDAWKYHKDNNRSPLEYENDYDYIRSCEEDLQNYTKSIFYEQLDILACGTTNPYILLAKDALDSRREEKANMRKY